MTSVDDLDQDPLRRAVKQEDPSDVKDNNERLDLFVSFLKPFLKFLLGWHNNDQLMEEHLNRIDSKLQNVIRDFKPPTSSSKSIPADTLGGGSEDLEHSSPTMEQLVVSKLSFLKGLMDEINEIVVLHNCRCASGDHVTCEKFEHFICFLNSVLQSLKDILLISVEKEVGAEQLEERLKFLINFLWLTHNPLSQSANMKAALNSAQKLAVEILHQLYICLLDGDDDDDELVGDHMRKDVLPGLIRKINTLLLDVTGVYKESGSRRLPDRNPAMNDHVLGFVDFLIQKLIMLLSKLNSESSFTVAVKVQIEILVDELSFLRCSLMDLLLEEVPDEEMTISMQALIVETGIFVFLSLDKEEGGELMAEHLGCGLAVLHKAVDDLRRQASNLFNNHFPPLLQTKFPCTNKLEFVDILVKELEDLICCKEASITPLEHQIELLKEEVTNLRKCFGEISELGKSQMEFLLTRFRDAAFLAKHAIDSFMAGEDSLWFQKLGLYVVTKDIRIMQKEIKSLLELTCHTNVLNVATASSPASSQAYNPPNTNTAGGSKVEIQNKVDEEPVGLEDATMKIMEQLTPGPQQLTILSIVGMPGLGKTTLANSVYNHPSVGMEFHVRAWCCLSQVYDKEAVLYSILCQIVPEINWSHEISADDVIQKLYQNLKGMRYLIVLDDIWDAEAWNGLKEIFPDDKNGSRILFTTRIDSVASEGKSFVHAHRLLSDEKSYELLLLRLFNGETCPQELSVILKRIADSCKGLPLAVVLIAGTLKRTEREKDSWEQIDKVLIRSRKLLEILELSYKHLPDHLKPCFRYFGTFPQSTTISASKMIRLWISEGFLEQPNFGQKSLKQEAESYLNDLIDRNLVMIARRSSKGGVKECRVHDVLRDFCSEKLEKMKSLKQENKSGRIAVLYGRSKHHGLNLFGTDFTSKVSSLVYYKTSDRIMNSGERKKKSRKYPSELVVRNFNHLSEWFVSQRRNLDYGSILKYKNLRVLDLGNVRVQNSADTSDLVEIAKLVHLKYLAVRFRTREIPSEIGNLRYLETFIVSGAISVILPEAIWKLESLRHIIMDDSFFSFEYYRQEFFENSSQLYNLISISTLSLCHGNIEKFLRRLPNIQKLGCISWRYDEAYNLFGILEFLQSLKMSFRDRAPCPFKFSFPSNLKKLTISKARLPWDEISVIGQLPNLEVLKLLNKAFEGRQWSMREGEFQKLKFLKLDSLDIVNWDAPGEHLPCLEQLVVLSCQQLEEIPSCFGENLTLQLIEMKWCSASATESVKWVLQKQRDLSNDQINIILVGPQHNLLID